MCGKETAMGPAWRILQNHLEQGVETEARTEERSQEEWRNWVTLVAVAIRMQGRARETVVVHTLS